jgi:hypothetical protein
MATTYTYTYSVDFPSGMDIQTFKAEVLASSIGDLFVSVDKMTAADMVNIVFDEPLVAAQTDVLDAIVANQTLGAALSLEASDDLDTYTNALWTEKVSLSAVIEQAGKYRVGWSMEWNHDNTHRNFQSRVQVDDTITIMEHVQEPSNSAATQWHVAAGFGYVNLVAGTTKIDLDFGASNAADTAGVRRARLEVWRTG